VRPYDAFKSLLADEPDVLNACRDFGIKIGLADDSPEWAYLMMPVLTRRLMLSEDLRKGQIEMVREAVKSVLHEEMDALAATLSTKVSDGQGTPGELVRTLKATQELLAIVKSALEISTARDEALSKLPERLVPIVEDLKKLTRKKKPSVAGFFASLRA
jgi:hypothetical protein